MSLACSRRAYTASHAAIRPISSDCIVVYRGTLRRIVHVRNPAPSRTFAWTKPLLEEQQQQTKESFRSRLNAALKSTKIEWKPIPIGLGIGFLGLFQFYRVQQREQRIQEEERSSYGSGPDGGKPKKRERIRPSGPWQVQIMSTLPLKALSRIWGRFNELEIPYYLRVPGFKLYSFIFGVNLSEVAEPDLHTYPNLASFFYRTLKPGSRPIDPSPNAIVSPADGKVIQFGIIDNGEVEQVKGVTYSLDALLGSVRPKSSNGSIPTSNIASSPNSAQPSGSRARTGDEEIIRADEEFAQINGISYTLPNLFSSPQPKGNEPGEMPVDQSTSPRASSEAEVRADLALAESSRSWWAPTPSKDPTALYYCVIYLAPGDYHRFHSPASWVVESRRHFAGELYSVSPYLQRTLPGLFTLNERVVLLGRWRWGFFSFTPVGATNVGSIVVNFDRELRTNSLNTDTAADRAAEEAAKRGELYSGFSEATYENASSVLGGHALKRGEEMGGFQLGSTIVLVFEAPKGRRPTFDEGYVEGQRPGGWSWKIKQGQKVKVGEMLGFVDE
ncbi:phosphatidylserine decarboxylase [Mytilinidion resinicola]|uniref:Phosphatidylserine decarboxylase proenzyme 1, mitochondrial n=1 Tax=Mytilinidion resinicola TaxID=574789 RepID=A0A6A6Z746_9PEZI|nr:phosphatidylserine decarboxylase [Mytilinidion resinicola]KAF2816124.1 phosphatidylserine decarboxylase [Mytilinidion resinicola]